jgi:hypothetical protein
LAGAGRLVVAVTDGGCGFELEPAGLGRDEEWGAVRGGVEVVKVSTPVVGGGTVTDGDTVDVHASSTTAPVTRTAATHHVRATVSCLLSLPSSTAMPSEALAARAAASSLTISAKHMASPMRARRYV